MARTSQRFPRWKLTGSEKLVMGILRLTYNKIAKSKDVSKRSRSYKNKRTWDWDIYRTKVGWRAMRAFMLLAPKLVEKKLDPSLYVKVLCRYGHYKNSRTMPHPAFLASDKALEIYTWLVKKDRQLYKLEEDWKRYLNVWTEEDAYASAKSSTRIFMEAKRQLGVPSSQVFLAIFKDLSPLFIAGYLYSSREWRHVRRALWELRKNSRLRHSVIRGIKSELER
jgi:hypothetical protein